MADDTPPIFVRRSVRGSGTKWSSWLVTINPNKRPKGETKVEVRADAERLISTLQGELDELVTGDVFPGIIKFLEEGHSWKRQYIEQVKAEYNIEIGPKTGAIHAHAVIEIEHRSKIHLDYGAIRSFFRAKGRPIHLDVKVIPGTGNALQYIRKQGRIKI